MTTLDEYETGLEKYLEAYSGEPEDFGPVEHFWVEHAVWLESLGYKLRPRYRPGWIPSWINTRKYPYNCEDSLSVGNTLISSIYVAYNYLILAVYYLNGCHKSLRWSHGYYETAV